MEADEKMCPFCAETIKVEAKVCKYCRKDLTGKVDNNQTPQINVNVVPPQPKSKSKIMGCLKICAVLFIILVIIGVIAGRRERDSGSSATGNISTNASSSTSATDNASTSMAVSGPSITNQQQAFIKANIEASSDFNSKSNEIQQEQARDRRKQNIKSSLGEIGNIKDWIGTVESIRTSTDGRGMISVRIHPSITLSTNLQIFGPSTLIEKSSPLFSIIGNLSEEDMVKFSGSFISSEKDYVEEDSLTIRGSMTEPDFTFIFSNIEKQ